MLTEVQSRLQVTSSTKFDARVKRELNNAYRIAVASKDWPQLRKAEDLGLQKADVSTLGTFESNQQGAPMPWDMNRLISIHIISPNDARLKEVGYSEIMRIYGDPNDFEGTPQYWCPYHTTAQYRPLAAADQLTVKSNNTGNDSANSTNRVARIHYRTADRQPGETHFEDLSGTFSSAGIDLSESSTPAGWPIERIELSAGWKGNLTIEDSSANEIVRIEGAEIPDAADTTFQNFARQLILLAPKPDQDYTGVIEYYSIPRRLVESHESPAIPVADYMVEAATAAIMRNPGRNWQAAAIHQQKADRLLGEFGSEHRTSVEEPTVLYGSILDGVDVRIPRY